MLLTERRRLVGFVCASLVLGCGRLPWAEERRRRSDPLQARLHPAAPPPSAIDMDAVEACLATAECLSRCRWHSPYLMMARPWRGVRLPIDSAVATCMYQVLRAAGCWH